MNAPSTHASETLNEEFYRRFQTLNHWGQAGVVTLLQKFRVRGLGSKLILEAMTSADAHNVKAGDWLLGPRNGSDHRIDFLSWIATDAGSLVGNAMTVDQALGMLEGNGHAGWPNE